MACTSACCRCHRRRNRRFSLHEKEGKHHSTAVNHDPPTRPPWKPVFKRTSRLCRCQHKLSKTSSKFPGSNVLISLILWASIHFPNNLTGLPGVWGLGFGVWGLGFGRSEERRVGEECRSRW